MEAYSTKDGKHKWTRKLPGDGNAPPAVGPGCFYVGRQTDTPAAKPNENPTESYVLWALDEATGKPRWQRALEGESSHNPPFVSNDRVFVVAEKRIHAMSSATGDLLWSRDLAGLRTAPAFAGDLMLLWGESLEEIEERSTSGSRSLFALDLATGITRWTCPLAAIPGARSESSRGLSRPFFRNGTLLFSDELHAFRLQQATGR